MKMFNMIGIGERAGSGIPDIYQIWKNEGWAMPVVEEKYNPDRTCLTLTFAKKQAIKTSDKKQANKSCHKKQNQKTLENIEKIREYLSKNNISKTSDIAEYIGLSLPRTRAILKEIPDVSPIGNNSNRKWTLQK